VAIESKFVPIRTGSLQLDPKNSRIPAGHRSDDQRKLLHELLEHEEVKELAFSISKMGLFPNELLVVMLAQPRRYTVLEGNRRLAAIRLLLNPELAPTANLVKYFRNLSAKVDLSALGKLNAVVVNDRIAAAPIIAALHTRRSKKRWSTLQQARFYRELVDEGQTPLEVAEEVGQTLGHVREFLRTEKLHRIALNLEYDSDVRHKIEDPKYPLSTLARFLESKVARKFLGVELNEDRGFIGTVHPDRFKAVLARIALDATRKGITREINTDTDFKTYVAKTEKKIQNTRIRGKFDPDVLLGLGGIEEGELEDQGEKKKPKPKVPTPSRSVVPRGFACPSRHDRVRAIFNEIKSMTIVNQKNSTGVMLRVLIDVALWEFIKSEGHAKAVCDHVDNSRKQRRHNLDWTPSLRELISYSVDKRLFPGMTADGYKSVRSLASKDSKYFITIDGLN